MSGDKAINAAMRIEYPSSEKENAGQEVSGYLNTDNPFQAAWFTGSSYWAYGEDSATRVLTVTFTDYPLCWSLKEQAADLLLWGLSRKVFTDESPRHCGHEHDCCGCARFHKPVLKFNDGYTMLVTQSMTRNI